MPASARAAEHRAAVSKLSGLSFYFQETLQLGTQPIPDLLNFPVWLVRRAKRRWIPREAEPAGGNAIHAPR